MNNQSLNINKSSILKKEIARFPSVFVEGAACCGKTTMVRQYLESLSAVNSDRLQLLKNGGQPVVNPQYGWQYRILTWGVSDFSERLADCLKWIANGSEVAGKILILNYRINSSELEAADQYLPEICEVIRTMPERNRIIFESREKPFPSLLDLIWHGEMGIISQNQFSLTAEEVSELLRIRESRISVRDMMKLTGGWAGVVQMLITVEKTFLHDECVHKSIDPVSLMGTYEIRFFIQEQILSSLTTEEQTCVELIRRYGWATKEMVHFFLQEDALLKDLERKGILYCYDHSEKYHVRDLFIVYDSEDYADRHMVQTMRKRQMNQTELPFSDSMVAFWYEENGYLQEAADLFRRISDSEFEAFLIREYTQAPFLKINLSDMVNNKTAPVRDNEHEGTVSSQERRESDLPSEMIYLTGIAALRIRDRDCFRECVKELDQRDGYDSAEMLINLVFADPATATDEWYKLVQKKAQKGMRFHLFHAKKRLDSCLYGVRELSDHFACLRRDQNRYERLFRTYFGPEEGKIYVFARAEYLIEACQEDRVTDEDWERMTKSAEEEPDRYLAILLRVHRMYQEQSGTLSKGIRMEQVSALSVHEERLQTLLSGCTPDSDPYLLVRLTQAVFPERSDSSEQSVRWIRENAAQIMKLDPDYYHYELFLLAKCFTLLRQYTKAERILKSLDPVLNRLTFSRLHAEALFLKALIHKNAGRTGLAAREVVESFAVSDPYRYAAFYTQYGDAGRELITEYLEWLKKSSSYKVHKKRYQYSSLLNVSQEDFAEALIRKCKKQKNQMNQMSNMSNKLPGTGSIGSDRERRGVFVAAEDPISETSAVPARRNSGEIGKGNSKENTRENSREYGREASGEHLTMMELIILQDLHEGLTNREICEKENLKLPTVKTHIYNVYKKLGVKNRGQAVKIAVERELIGW